MYLIDTKILEYKTQLWELLSIKTQVFKIPSSTKTE